MEAKSILYAAVGAPVVAARRVGDRVSALRGKISEERAGYTKTASKVMSDWAVEGEKLVSRISEGKVVEEISSKVDLGQAKEQVGKLRDQLEDMLDTWRHSFRPDKAGDEVEKAAADKPATKKKPAAKTSATKKPATKTSAAKTTQSSTAAKTSSAKSAPASKAGTSS